MLKFKCLECTPWPILYRNIFSFSTWKKNFIGQTKKKLWWIFFFLRFEQLKKMITKIGENRIRRFVVWYDELINEFLYIFSLNFQYEIRKYVLFSRVDRRASTDRMSLNQFKLVCLQFKSIFAMMFVHAHMNSAIFPLWTFFWTFTIWAEDFWESLDLNVL